MGWTLELLLNEITSIHSVFVQCSCCIFAFLLREIPVRSPTYESLLKALRRVDLNIAELLNSSTVQNEIDWLNLTRDKMTGVYKNILFAKEYRESNDDPR